VQNLRDGTGTPTNRLNGGFFLNESADSALDTLLADSDADLIDVLTGSSGEDWFIFEVNKDKVTSMSTIEAQQTETID
jgi:hypothetical protein